MNYTGYLTKNGKPVNTSATPLAVVVKLYPAVTGGIVPLWQESFAGVVVKDGVFSLVLGKTKALSAAVVNGQARYAEIVLGAQTMTPRLALRTVPHAFAAENCTGHLTPKSIKVGVNGNIGVGTSMPASALHAEGRSPNNNANPPQITLSDYNSSNSLGYYLANTNYVMGRLGFGGYASNGKLNTVASVLARNTSTTNTNGLFSGQLEFAVKNNGVNKTAMVIDKKGNVGIGTASSKYRLEVAGTITASGSIVGSALSAGYATLRSTSSNDVKLYNNAPGKPIVFELRDTSKGNYFEAMRMVVHASKHVRVGIGTPTPKRVFDVNGDAGGTTPWYSSSDRKLKKRIRTISGASDKVSRLRGVSFQWRDTASRPAGKQLGLVAQEVMRVLPEVVSKKGKNLSVQYGPVVAVLIEAMKEQQREIRGLKKEVASLRSYVRR